MNKLLTAVGLLAIMSSCTNHQNQFAKITEIDLPAGKSSAEPSLFTDKNGTVYLSWIEQTGKKAFLKFSTLSAEKWSEPTTIDSGSNWFVNWADHPVMAADGNSNLVAHYLEKSAKSTYAYDVKFRMSADAGKSWSAPTILHDDGKEAEHGFVSIVPFKDNFFVSWLDGRNTNSMDGMDHEGSGQMTLRGTILTKNGVKENEWELDHRVCDCCQTSVAITENGPVVVYRDRSDDEIRDISVVRWVNGNWTKPALIFPDNWKINGCPVNGPKADALGNNLAIAWFSMAGKKGEVKLVFSDDGGANFKSPIRIDEDSAIGRVDVVMLNNNTAMVSWMEGATIKVRRVNADGNKELPITIASSSETRSSGFPQMTKAGNKLYFAW